MRSSLTLKIVFVFWLTSICFSSYAQQIAMEVKRDTLSSRHNLMDLVATLENNDNQAFEGHLNIKTPDGFQSVSGTHIDVQLAPGQRRFVPVKIIYRAKAEAGTSLVEIDLLDKNNNVLQTDTIGQTIKVNNSMRLSARSPMVFINNANDSLTIEVAVSNLGNQNQDVSVVFSIPGLTGERNFFEKKGIVPIQKDSLFSFTFMPSQALLNRHQFTINVAAMRGTDKELFGNLSITAQNISSSRRFQDLEATRQSQYHRRNSVTGSYRTLGNNNSAYQFFGSGGVNLPAGYLFANGNIYKSNHADEAIVSNTYLEYHLDKHQLKIGNIHQSSEISLFGRGAELSIADEDNSLQVGFVDQNFNLIAQDAFMKRGHAFFAKGILGASNPKNFVMGNYIFKEDVMEQAKHHVVGIERAKIFNKEWSMTAKMHAGISHYHTKNKNEPSVALETRYMGEIGDWKLSGNYYYSTNYFPGNRRGMLQIQQSAFTKISPKHTAYANFNLFDFSPKSHTYVSQMKSKNLRFEAGVNFLNTNNTTLRLGYLHQAESGNSFGDFSGTSRLISLDMSAHRLNQNINWLSPNNKHSVLLTLEEGFSKISGQKKLLPQLKLTSNYSFKWLNSSFTYQYGSFYLSEYSMSQRRTNEEEEFQRLAFTLSINNQFFKNKLSLNSGIGFTKDFTVGQTPSAFINAQYFPHPQYRIYVNSSWYRYDMQNNNYFPAAFSNNTFVVEVGLTVNFKGQALSSGKKGKLTALVYLDKNANNIFDEGDEIASDYLITINKTTFKTDSNGMISYQSLPYESYQIKPTAQKGWFTSGFTYEVNKYQNEIEIPLHQSGTLYGKIHYDYDPVTVLDFEPKYRGLIFNIHRNGRFIQRVSTNDAGEFVLFLPQGDYQVSLVESSLPTNTYCSELVKDISVKSGQIAKISPFVIEVKERKINIKKFGS